MREGYEEYWREGVDLKRFVLCMKRKFWMVPAAALVCALLFAVCYLAVWTQKDAAPRYRSEALFAIRYNVQKDDETLKAFINEYNAYTWGDMMRSDRVTAAVMKELPDMSRAQLEDSLDTAIASDPEFLTAGFTAANPALSERIRDAYIRSMEAFGTTLRERGLTAIEAWKVVPAVRVREQNRAANAAALGLTIGFFAGLLLLAGRYVLDDRVLLSSDVERRYEIPVLGYRMAGPGEKTDPMLEQNLSYRKQKGTDREISVRQILEGEADFEALRRDGAILTIPWNTPCLRLLDRVFSVLRAQDVALSGAVIEGADGRFLSRYYGKDPWPK